MPKPNLGMKRLCLSCGAKFYDLNRDPILCPKCGAQFQVQMLQRRPEPAKVEEEDEIVVDPAVAELVPLEEVEESVPEKVIADDDIDVDEDIGAEADDTFLETEEEEDGGDVADLIDGDIEDDEES